MKPIFKNLVLLLLAILLILGVVASLTGCKEERDKVPEEPIDEVEQEWGSGAEWLMQEANDPCILLELTEESDQSFDEPANELIELTE
jgi:hypothetical protein